MIEHLIDILKRVNRDPDLVAEINGREDLGFPDLGAALHCAEQIKDYVNEILEEGINNG